MPRARTTLTTTIERSIEVHVPRAVAYERWEALCRDPVAVVDRVPGSHIAWRTAGEADGGGEVTFRALGERRASVMVRIRVGTAGSLEKVAEWIAVLERGLALQLERFKESVERYALAP